MITPYTNPHTALSAKVSYLFGLFAATSLAFAQNDPVMDEGFDEHGLKTIQFDEGEIPPIFIHPDMTAYDSANRGIPDAVMKHAGYSLDTNTDTTILGGISLRNRYRWGLSITDESTCGDGISDWVKMRPPGWEDNSRTSPLFFTITEEGVAEATPVAKGDRVFLPNLGDYEETWDEKEKMVAGKKITFSPHYALNPLVKLYECREHGV